MPTSGEIWQAFMGRGVNIGLWEERGLGSMASHLENMMNTQGWSLEQAWQHVQVRLGEVSTLQGDVTRPPSAAGQPPRPPETPATSPAPTGPSAAEQQDTKASLKATLDKWGLGSLVDWAYDQVIVQDKSIDYVLSVLLPEQQAYKDRFRADEIRKANNLPVLGAATILAIEEQRRQLFRAAGLAAGFFDSPDDHAEAIGRDESILETAARIEQGYLRVAQAPIEDRLEAARLYGVQADANLAAWFLDPARSVPLLLRQVRAIGAAGASVRAGYGQINLDLAERIADLGLSEQAVAEGFGTLVESRPLLTSFDVGEDVIGADVAERAAFGGDAVAQEIIRRRQRRRQARFESGGGFATSAEGYAGLGAAT